MKQIFIGLIALSAITFSATAQDGTGTTGKPNHKENSNRRKHHDGKHDKAMMNKNLNFSDAQKQQAKSINSDFENRMKDLKKNDNMTVKDFNAQKEALVKERKSKMESLLTAEQKTQLQQSKKDRGSKAGKHNTGSMDKMKTGLGLNDDQVSKMNDQRAAFKVKADAIKNNQSLTKEQKKDQFEALRNEQKAGLQNILTADQQRKLEDRKGKRPMKTT